MKREEALQWWKEAKLGLFIHWGLYSLLGEGEWVMYAKRIPAGEYEKLAAKFNPSEFHAKEWVQFARDSGMKYIVITAKHHDGFSMFRTNVSRFNIVDATPFCRDPLAELAGACREAGIKLGFYYSHVREWRHPLANSFEKKGRGDLYGNYGNFWDYPNENLKCLQTYIEEFDLPQLKELLTQYGDILTIWFDTPSQITPGQGRQIRELVYDLQDGCLVNSRLSEDIGVDYLTMMDNGIPASGLERPWETPMTTHNGWGYVKNAVYQTHGEILRKIAEIAGKGGNLLLNVGPDANGRIPEGAKNTFAQIGRWLRENGEAVYGTHAAGIPYLPGWGYVTQKENALYLLVTDPEREEAAFAGLKSRVIRCEALAGKEALPFEQTADFLRIDIRGMEGDVRVIKVDCQEKVQIKKGLYPGEDGSVELPASLAGLCRQYPYSKMEVKYGVTQQWFSVQDSLRWEFKTWEEGDFRIQVLWDTGGFWGLEDFGHELEVCLDKTAFGCIVTETAADAHGIRKIDAGNVTLAAGEHTLSLTPGKVVMDQLTGLQVSGVRLEKIEK